MSMLVNISPAFHRNRLLVTDAILCGNFTHKREHFPKFLISKYYKSNIIYELRRKIAI